MKIRNLCAVFLLSTAASHAMQAEPDIASAAGSAAASATAPVHFKFSEPELIGFDKKVAKRIRQYAQRSFDVSDNDLVMDLLSMYPKTPAELARLRVAPTVEDIIVVLGATAMNTSKLRQLFGLAPFSEIASSPIETTITRIGAVVDKKTSLLFDDVSMTLEQVAEFYASNRLKHILFKDNEDLSKPFAINRLSENERRNLYNISILEMCAVKMAVDMSDIPSHPSAYTATDSMESCCFAGVLYDFFAMGRLRTERIVCEEFLGIAHSARKVQLATKLTPKHDEAQLQPILNFHKLIATLSKIPGYENDGILEGQSKITKLIMRLAVLHNRVDETFVVLAKNIEAAFAEGIIEKCMVRLREYNEMVRAKEEEGRREAEAVLLKMDQEEKAKAEARKTKSSAPNPSRPKMHDLIKGFEKPVTTTTAALSVSVPSSSHAPRRHFLSCAQQAAPEVHASKPKLKAHGRSAAQQLKASPASKKGSSKPAVASASVVSVSIPAHFTPAPWSAEAAAVRASAAKVSEAVVLEPAVKLDEPAASAVEVASVPTASAVEAAPKYTLSRGSEHVPQYNPNPQPSPLYVGLIEFSCSKVAFHEGKIRYHQSIVNQAMQYLQGNATFLPSQEQALSMFRAFQDVTLHQKEVDIHTEAKARAVYEVALWEKALRGNMYIQKYGYDPLVDPEHPHWSGNKKLYIQMYGGHPLFNPDHPFLADETVLT